MLTPEDKAEISSLVKEALEEEREAWFSRAAKLDEERQKRQETKLYLIAMAGPMVALPDQDGRAILHQTVYARVTMDGKSPQFYGGRIEVVALGDGRMLKQPIGLVLPGHGVTAFAEVNEVPQSPKA